MTKTRKNYDFSDIRQLVLACILWYLYVFFWIKIVADSGFFAIFLIFIINSIFTLRVLRRLIVGLFRSLEQTSKDETDYDRLSWLSLIIGILLLILISSVNSFNYLNSNNSNNSRNSLKSIERDFYFLRDELQSIVTNVVTGKIEPDSDGYLPGIHSSNSSFRNVNAQYYNKNWVIKFTRYMVGFGDGRVGYLYYSGDQDLSVLFKQYGEKINLYIPYDNSMSNYKIDKITDHWFWVLEYW